MTDSSKLKLSAIIDLSLDELELVEQDNNPEDFGENKDALWALDHAKLGHVGAALELLIDSPFRDDLDRRVTPYYKSPAEFKRDMRQLSSDLKREGL